MTRVISTPRTQHLRALARLPRIGDGIDRESVWSSGAEAGSTVPCLNDRGR
jgi:hypothetical protein